MILGVLKLAAILSQAAYRLWIKPETDRLTQLYWDACVNPGKGL